MSSWHPEVDISLTDSEEEENENLRDFSKGREAILFVVDAGMLVVSDHFEDALGIIRRAFISALLVNDKDLMGVVFANTEHSPEPIEANCLENIVVPSNCAVLLPLRQLSKAIVEYLLNFVQGGSSRFAERYGRGHCNFASLLRLCHSLFQHCGYPCNNATIVYLTDAEFPHDKSSPEYRRALLKAKELGEQDIEFHIIPMVDDFNYDIFYKDFLTLVRNVEVDSFVPPDARQLREILADRKLKQDIVRRTLGNFEFSLGPGLNISVQYFNYFKKRSYPRKVLLLRKDNSIVQKKRKIVVSKQDSETEETIEEREVATTSRWYEIKVGNDAPIRISLAQINRLRNLHEPGMMLLGFKSADVLTQTFYYKPSNFMYPVDSRIAGSKRLFYALWQRCYEREKIAICLFLSRRNSIPRYVALVPVKGQDPSTSTAESADYKSLLSGDGFKIVYLPFANHIRRIDFSEWNTLENEAPAEGVECFEKIIRKLRMRYEPNLINDPVLELLQAQLLALALNITTENEGRTDMPDVETQDERIKQILPEFKEIFGEDDVSAKKRTLSRAANEDGKSATKIPKISEENVESYEFVEQMIANKTLSACTVVQLRSILDKHFGVKMPATKKKQDLIDHINKLSV